MTTKREKRLAELKQMAMEWNCSTREVMLEVLFMILEHEFPIDYIENELCPKTDEELLEVYLNW